MAQRRKHRQDAQFAPGDHVEWHAPQGTIRGTVERKLTKPAKINDHAVAASPDNPEYLVRSDRTGAHAAHAPAALKAVK